MKRFKLITIGVLLIVLGTNCSNNRKDLELVEQGKKFFLEENYTEAIPYFTKAIYKNTRNDEAHAYRGFCYYELEDYPTAMVDFSNALIHNPNNGTALFGDACIRWNLEDYNQAFRELDKLIQLNPDHDKAYFYRGRAFLYRNDTLSALNDLATAMQKDSCFIDTYYLLSSIKTAQKDFEAAENYLNMALKCKEKTTQN